MKSEVKESLQIGKPQTQTKANHEVKIKCFASSFNMKGNWCHSAGSSIKM